MTPLVRAVLAFAVSSVRARVSRPGEIVALRHQLPGSERSSRRPRVRRRDRIVWSWLARQWARWRDLLGFVQPATGLAWPRPRFRDHWARRSCKDPGRPAIPKELRELLREISTANPQGGSPRSLGAWRTLGIAVANSTVEQDRGRPRRPSAPSWRAFLKSHLAALVALDCCPVPPVGFKVFFGLVILAPERRNVVHFKVPEQPTAPWTAQQLVEAFPWATAPKVPAPGPGWGVGREVSAACRALGDCPHPARSPESVATCRCGAGDREHPASVAGSGHGGEGGSPPAPARQLRPGCSSLADAALPGHGWPCHPPGATACAGRSRRRPGRGWVASPLRADGGVMSGDRRFAGTRGMRFREGHVEAWDQKAWNTQGPTGV